MNISVIIPTFNRQDFLTRTIESVLEQSYKADEIILIDDGSNDETKDFVKQYPIKYIYQTNQGVSAARNRGIKEARNEWLCFLDSDDIWHENKLLEQVKFHSKDKDILFSYTDERWIYNSRIMNQNKKQRKLYKNSFLDHLDQCTIGVSTTMIHRVIIDDIGMFDIDLKVCEDYDLWLRILNKFKVGYIDLKLIDKIAGHSGQLSFDVQSKDYYRILALKKHLKGIYNREVKHKILEKKEILYKGALKHNNKFYQDFCLSLNSFFEQ